MIDDAHGLIDHYARLGVRIDLRDLVAEMLPEWGSTAIAAMLSDPAHDWTGRIRGARPLSATEVDEIYWAHNCCCLVDYLGDGGIAAKEMDAGQATGYFETYMRLIDDPDTTDHGRKKLRAILAQLLAAHPNADDPVFARITKERAARQTRMIFFLGRVKRLQTAPALTKEESGAPEPIAPRVSSAYTAVTRKPKPRSRDRNQTLPVFDSPQHNALSARTQALIGFADRRCAGCNNGELFFTASALRTLGFTCFAGEKLATSLGEAVHTGFFVVMRERCGKRPARYGLTWLPLPGEAEPRNTWTTISPKATASTTKPVTFCRPTHGRDRDDGARGAPSSAPTH